VWKGLPSTGVTVFVFIVCMFILICGYLSLFDIIIVITVIITTNIIIYMGIYVHARPVIPGIAQLIMPTVHTYGSLNT